MIPQETVDKIIETSRIDEVVGDFVSLKRRGTSLIGLCPFHNEKTPSFNVSINKGIFKCFGCGKGGDSVRFIMEHEKSTYPDALRYLANKYNIEIAEIESSPEAQLVNDHRESLFIVSAWAAKFFQQQMLQTEEGKAIGLSYFQERGFREDVIKKFELGYSPDVWDALTQKAVSESYNLEFLEETGLTIRKDSEKVYDRFRGRVMFPIHSFTGRVIGFGGRTLKTDKAVPKYVNSPESEIYHKSNILYGLFFAKKAIRDEDNCYLVEGYADVLSVNQAGVENVVASSGTSLTIEQIRLIGRFTKNITILYDGDAAGVKAAMRGVSVFYKDGFNIRVVVFPENNDPDSYIQKYGSNAFKTFINGSALGLVDFFIKNLDESELKDPIRKIKAADDLAQIIANHPEPEFRSDYIKKAAEKLKVDEQGFLRIVNKHYLKLYDKKPEGNRGEVEVQNQTEENNELDVDFDVSLLYPDENQEKEIIRLLLNYGHELVHWDGITDTYIAPYVISNLADVEFDHPECRLMIAEYKDKLEAGEIPSDQDFIKHANRQIADMTISLVSSPYLLSENWYAKRKIFVRDETENLRATILGGIFHLKKRKVEHILKSIRDEIQHETDEVNQAILMRRYLQVKEVEKGISQFLGSVIVK